MKQGYFKDTGLIGLEISVKFVNKSIIKIKHTGMFSKWI